ncbi:MAG TPA: hypothetical protein VEX70_16480 [Pyrinomonadaceae bacterium]|nr:hypothetical protein [Pyrinomonadaceae bacterium]
MNKPEQKDSYRSDIFTLIKSLTGQNNVLTIPVEFIHYTGSIDAALFLSQLLYWTDKGRRADGFIYKTYKEWENEICLSEYEVKKARKNLEAKGILETKVMRANGNPTVHYFLDSEKFSESFLEFLKNRKASNPRNDSIESAESLTETTAETITENTSPFFVSPDGDENDIDKKAIDAISDEISKRLSRLNPVIPKFKSERTALRAMAEEVYRGSCSINSVLLCAESLASDVYRNMPIIPTTVYRELGSFLRINGRSDTVEFLIEQSKHPELYISEREYEESDESIPF